MDVNIIRGIADLNGTDAYTCTLTVKDNRYVHGGWYLCRVNSTNTIINPTFNFNSIGAKTVVHRDFSALRIGELKVDTWIAVIYDEGEDKLVLMDTSPWQGVDTTTLTDVGGTTITLIPGTHNPIQRIAGSATSASNYVFTFGGSPKDGDRFYFDYRATMTLGAQTITIAGISLTAVQALDGNLWIEAYYDTDAAAWVAKLFNGGIGRVQQVFANKASRDAAVPDFNGQKGIQIDIDAEFQANGTSAGNWIDTIPPSNIVYADSVKGHTLAQGATGAKSNPFSTLTEAHTAADALSESATNRILIDAQGSFNEQPPLKSYIDYNFNNSIVDFTTNSATYTITDGGVACDVIIYGNAIIKRSAGGSALGAVLISHANSNVRIFCDYIDATIGIGVRCTAGTLWVRSIRGVNGVTGFDYRAGTCTINGDIFATTTGVIYTCVGSPIINGNITVSNGKGIIESGDAVTSGVLYVNGNISATNNYAIHTSLISFCVISVKGNITASGAIAINCESGTGNISVKDGTISNSGSGDCISGATILLTLDNCSITSSSGKCIATTQNSVIAAKNCSIISSADDAISINNGASDITRFENCYIKTTDTNANAVTIVGAGNFKIFKDCTLIANGSGASIYAASALNVRLLGHNDANLNKNANVTILGSGTLNIDSNNS